MTEYSEFIMRVQVSEAAREQAEEILKKYAKTFAKVGLTRIDREDHGTHSMHIRRKRII